MEIVQQVNSNDIQIIESQYFGTVNWYKMLFENSHVELAQYEAYPKTSFRNRTIIAGSNGLIILSVPLQKGRIQKNQTRDVKISYDQDWQEQHWRSIVSCYGKSPFFEYYQNSLELVLRQKQVYLLDMNWGIQQWVLKQLKFTRTLNYSFRQEAEFRQSSSDQRDRIKPNNFHLVQEPVKYSQVFEDRIGFQANLSILDLLSCMGPASKTLL
ncbi:MAG: hypothetical protein B7Y15_08250 [Bacteroidetes bacterium 24-39-8]|nr:MAG: hypothetical protein B7Y15_08250 [Bacteroidetes bacterium 24-39-8]OZA68934.1 MAG: hypothetical protein B7X72_00985 [Sphingobacteriia bacterium 39-39-8]HQR93333.1 WbqC family protein [Sediminibacterium sp.]HQS55268.1 WbqC family protein [Sediminibacterium sp.]